MRKRGFESSSGRAPGHVRRIVAALLLAGLAFLQAGGTAAQQAPNASLQNLTPEQLQQLLAGQAANSLQRELQGVESGNMILEPTAPEATALPQSRLEQILSARVGVTLKQFGYDQLGVGRPVNLPQVGAVQDDYILGPGDEIVVTMRGQDNSEHRVAVDRDGNVVLPRISPIAAVGRTLGDFRAQLLSEIHSAYMATEAYVTIGRLRQISVMVAGEVGSPGVRILTGLSTPVDALLVSGGIKKSGSLRNVRLIHQGRTISLDLYSYLTAGAISHQITLGDGDRIVVPPLTKIVAVAGWVRRPGIYELLPGQSGTSVAALSVLAGGIEVRGRYRIGILRVQSDGQTQLAPMTSQSNIVRDGEILLVLPGADQVVDRATLAGGTALAGSYWIKAGTHLSDVLKAPGALGRSPYTVFGIISRRDSRTYLRSLIAFSPIAVLAGENDPPLASDDIVRVFSMREGRLLSQSVTQFAANKQYQEELTRNPFAVAPAQSLTPQNGQQQAATGGTNPAASNDQSVTGQLPSTASAPAALALQAANATAGGNGQSAATNQAPNSTAPNQAAPGSTSSPTPPNGTTNPWDTLADISQRRDEAQPLAPPPANYEQEVSAPGTVPLNSEVTTLQELAVQLDVDTTVLLNFLSDHQVTLDGAVRGPGSYVVGPGINLHDLVMVAGGTARWADESGVELTSTNVDQATGNAVTIRKTLPLNEATLAKYTIKPHDELRFRQVYTVTGLDPVTLEGEVRFPGQYKIVRGEHLLDLLKRAGGLTDVAYPYGTVFLRQSIAALEEESFRRVADQVENQLLAAMSRPTIGTQNTRLDPTAFTALQGFVQTLRTQKGLGRMSVTADPNVLAAHPNENPLLEPGDVIYIPQRPSTVSVLGEVLQPGSYTHRQNLTPNDYLAKAGGYSAYADGSLTYIILPDGSAEKLDQSWLPFNSRSLPPGSVIVVPRDIAPFDWTDILLDSTQIFSQLAIAGASLAVISGK